jgi:protein-tyrosine phosphatase
MARVVAQKMAHDLGIGRKLQIDSAGTHAPSPAQRTDPRAIAALERRGYSAKRQRSSRIASSHFTDADLVLAMDNQNMAALQKICPADHTHKLRLLLSFAPECGRTEVPDPYHSNAQAFDLVLDLCEASIGALLRHYTL